MSGSPSGHGLCSRTDVGSPERPPLAPPDRGNQALAAGSETRRRSVDGVPRGFSGGVCFRNSPRPCESRSHLSGGSCRERGSGEGARPRKVFLGLNHQSWNRLLCAPAERIMTLELELECSKRVSEQSLQRIRNYSNPLLDMYWSSTEFADTDRRHMTHYVEH